jgi:bisphosphoglycerate-dependent phosphoglycerate mutase
MTKDHFLYDQIHKSRQFQCMPYIPGSESLADVRARLIPLLQGELAQDLAAGKRVLICGHSNSLRALITLLEGESDSSFRFAMCLTVIKAYLSRKI